MTVEEHLQNTNANTIRIFVIRHGQTAWNMKKILQGQTNIPLNEKGLAQADLIGSYLEDLEIDEFVSSDLTRCVQTITPIITNNKRVISNNSNGIHEVRFRRTKNLRERYMGEEVQGNYLSDLIKKYGQDYRRFGEAGSELLKRLETEWNTILDESFKNEFKNVLICTHGSVIRNFVQFLYNEKKFKLADGISKKDLIIPYNTSVTIVDINRSDLSDGIVQCFGETRHLGELKVADQDVI